MHDAGNAYTSKLERDNVEHEELTIFKCGEHGIACDYETIYSRANLPNCTK